MRWQGRCFGMETVRYDHDTLPKVARAVRIRRPGGDFVAFRIRLALPVP